MLSVVLAALLGCGSAHAQEDVFRIGALGTFSGPFSVMGESMRRGAELAVELRGNEVLGVPVEFVWEDDETKPQVAVQKATRMVSNGVQMLFAPVSSGSTAAVMTIAQRSRTPFLVTLSSSDAITGADRNDYTFRTANLSSMEVAMMGKYVEAAGFRKVYVLATDYKVGRDSADSLKQLLSQAGVEIAGEDYPALGTTDFSILVNKVLQSDAEAAYLGLAGNDLISFIKQADQVKLQDRKALFGQIIMDESLGRAVGEAGIGINSALRYHFSIDNPANKAFVEAFRAKYGEHPDQYAGEAFDGVAWFLDVVDSTGSWEKQAWLDAFRGSTRENSVEGVKTMRACDNQAAQTGYYGVGVEGTGDLPRVTMNITEEFPADALFKPCE